MPNITSKNDVYIFNKFVRNYINTIQHFGRSELLSMQKIMKILHYLGYVDEYINNQVKQLIHSIAFMISKEKNCLVTEQSLFNFLRIISNVPFCQYNYFKRDVQGLATEQNIAQDQSQPLIKLRLGYFNQLGDWDCHQSQQNQIKDIFGNMNIKRISRQKIEAQIKQNNFLLQQTFQPQILEKSRNMAEKRYKKLSITKKSAKVQDRLLENLSIQKSHLQSQMNKSRQKQMKECYFKPKINTSKRKVSNYSLSKYADSMNSSFQNKQNIHSVSNIFLMKNDESNQSINSMNKNRINLIGDKLLMKGKQYDRHKQSLKKQYQQFQQQIQLKECTFQPKLSQKAHLNKNNKYIRNAQKSIQRMKQARKKREFENKFKERGYPTNVQWTKFISSYKNQQIQNKSPILCIDLKIFDETKNIKVYEGSSIEDISQKICIQNSISQQFWKKVEILLKSSLQKCNQIKFVDNRVYVKQ